MAGNLTYIATPDSIFVNGAATESQSVSISITAVNSTPNGITLKGIQFSLPVGTGGSDLTSDASGIQASAEQSNAWSVESPERGVYRLIPNGGIGSLASGDSLTLQLQDVPVLNVTGAAAITILEHGSGGDSSSSVVIVKEQSPLEIKSFTGDPTTITAGGSATLSWDTVAASSVSIEPGNHTSLAADGELTVTPETTTTYTLTAQGDGPNLTQQFTVTVDRVTILEFVASNPTLSYEEPTSELSWKVENADSVTIEPVGGPVENKGSLTVRPYDTSTFTITAKKGADQVQKQVTISVPLAPRVDSFEAKPSSIDQGGFAKLTWAGLFMGKVTLKGTSFGNALPDRELPSDAESVYVKPELTTDYTIEFENDNGTGEKSATVNVKAKHSKVTQFECSPNSYPPYAESVTFTWKTENASSVSISSVDPPNLIELTIGQNPNGSVTVPLNHRQGVGATCSFKLMATGVEGATPSESKTSFSLLLPVGGFGEI